MTLKEMIAKLEEINIAGLSQDHLRTLSEQARSYDLNLSRSAEEKELMDTYDSLLGE
ncbi:hypothetical protein [Porphyromonas uenonis]|uniref:hypothetical protein n=1 Tax=Porphyromonas uenonis TaxID=281920 RepID=UPI0012B60A31|nr:hypothetical protein [Porphyromonas uenonis]